MFESESCRLAAAVSLQPIQDETTTFIGRIFVRRPCVAALGAFALAQIFAGEAAAQACNTSASPPQAIVTLPNVNGQTFPAGRSPATSSHPRAFV